LKKDKVIEYNLEEKINFSVFPGMQGGPHNHTIAALATTLKQAAQPEFVDYQKQVIANCLHYSNTLKGMGYKLVSDGTDNHLILVDLKKSRNIDGARVERVLELANISVSFSLEIYCVMLELFFHSSLLNFKIIMLIDFIF
jgi:glycine hydroxymethyltransferase